MSIPYLKILISRPESIAWYFRCPQETNRLIPTRELFELWKLARSKARFIETQSNYHTAEVSAHTENERLLRTLLEKRMGDFISDWQ
jgi:hypothetical protein